MSAEKTEWIEDIKPPATSVGWLGWVKQNLFNSPFNSVLTVLAMLLLATSVPPLINWAFIESVWTGTSADCRQANGACWAFVYNNVRFMLFGFFPTDDHWRPALSVVIFVGMLIYSGPRHRWNAKLLYVWMACFVLIGILLRGGLLGLTSVEDDKWGGLPLTLLLSVVGIVFAYPLGILLALGRRSEMPAIRSICIGYIELIRGVPLISLLFMASVMFPLFLPEGVSVNKLLRAQVAIIMFTAAYLAEVVRGGLQAIPKGQYEAADALGLNYVQKMRLIILPQALKIMIPPTVSIFITAFKDTSLVVIIALFDLLLTTKTSLTNADWLGYSSEGYVFIALIYFTFCYSMSRYSVNLEKELNTSQKK